MEVPAGCVYIKAGTLLGITGMRAWEGGYRAFPSLPTLDSGARVDEHETSTWTQAGGYL